MRANRTRIFFVAGVWLIPILLIMIEAAVFLGKANWGSSYIVYFITFWALRAVLSPLIVWYTLTTQHYYKKWHSVLLVHLAGFIMFSAIFWTSAYLILHGLLNRNEFFGVERTSTNMQVFAMIVDNSISTNSIVYFSTVVFCYMWEYLKQNILITQKASALERSLLLSRLDYLKVQLNTHFLFNTLHTISSLVVRNQNEAANKMLIGLSELLRFALKENKEQLIPLHRELELLQLYVDIQQTRFKDRLMVQFQVEPLPSSTMIPSMLLQPLVENAVRYGVEPYSEPGIVTIDIRQVNGSLHIAIGDHGQKSFTSIDFSSGVGLTNTRERLQKLYPGCHQFSVTPNNGQGVLVQIEIPNQTTEDVTTAYSDR
jgi:sensor histidine kinase YesM